MGVFFQSATSNAFRIVQVAFIAISAALAYSYVASARDGELRKSCTSLCTMAPDYAGEDRMAPDFELTTTRGSRFRLADQRGKTVLLVFWNTACDACKKQMLALRQLASTLSEEPRFQLLTVAVDESAAEVVSVLEQHTGSKDPFAVALDPDAKVVTGRYGTKMYPETWLIDPAGKIRLRFDGPRDWSSPIAMDVLRGLSRDESCPMTIESMVARGPGARICQEIMP